MKSVNRGESKKAIKPFLQNAGTVRLDEPQCDVMVHCLVARLLMLDSFKEVSW